jgi:hypothetical protein
VGGESKHGRNFLSSGYTNPVGVYITDDVVDPLETPIPAANVNQHVAELEQNHTTILMEKAGLAQEKADFEAEKTQLTSLTEATNPRNLELQGIFE